MNNIVKFISAMIVGVISWLFYCVVFKVLTVLMHLDFNLSLITCFWIIMMFCKFIFAYKNERSTTK